MDHSMEQEEQHSVGLEQEDMPDITQEVVQCSDNNSQEQEHSKDQDKGQKYKDWRDHNQLPGLDSENMRQSLHKGQVPHSGAAVVAGSRGGRGERVVNSL